MKAKRSRRIVIDANIARAAGTSEVPSSTISREFLESVLRICHRIVITPPIRDEWRRHMSRFSSEWFAAMESRKKVERLAAQQDVKLRQKLGSLGLGPRQREEAAKDAHLLEAALAADRIVCSLEKVAPDQFRLLAKVYGPVRTITWVNPGVDLIAVSEWLTKGAPAASHWQLRS